MFNIIKKLKAEIAQKQQTINELRAQLVYKETLENVLEKVTTKLQTTVNNIDILATKGYVDSMLDSDLIAIYVDDCITGGKVIKQEATPVTILDKEGKASYGFTREKADKNRAYKLVLK